jgi:hypothetical protein
MVYVASGYRYKRNKPSFITYFKINRQLLNNYVKWNN